MDHDDEEQEQWAEHKAERRAKRWRNVESSLRILRERGIAYETLNEKVAHYRVKGISFWPSTGVYFDPKSGVKGRGIMNLIKQLNERRG